MGRQARAQNALSKREIAQIAAAEGARVALTSYEANKERMQKKEGDRRLHDTKLLLRNYRLLKASMDESVADAKQVDQQTEKLLERIWEASDNGYSDLYIDSIRRSKTRTVMLMAHVDKMLKVYQYLCEISDRPEEQRRFRIIKALYLSDVPMAAGRIADVESIDIRTVYKDVSAACDTLTHLLFGLNGLSL